MTPTLQRIFRHVFGNPAPQISAVQNSTSQTARAPYEAGSAVGHRTTTWDVPDVSANVATANQDTIRARCRHAVRNDSWANAIVETLVDDLIGWGVRPMCRAADEPVRQAVQALWDDWAAVADADGVLDLAGLQSLAVRNWIVDGECFVRLRRRLPEDQLPVPLQLQVLPSDICPIEHTATSADGNPIKQGIEYSRIGQRLAYWFRQVPPGEDDPRASSAELTRVPAGQVLHLFEPLRPGQRRGVSRLAPGLVRLRELDKYADATLLRLQLATMFVASLKRQQGGEFDPFTGERVTGGTPSEPNTLQLTPGTFQELDTNETLEFNDPPDPPVGFEAFVKHELRAAGGAVGVPLECFTHDWGATNDRLARVVLNQYRRRVHRLLWSIVVPQLLRPLWNTWIDLALTAPKALPGAALTDPQVRRVTFAPHAHAYVHPVQDVASYREAIRSGLTSRQAAVAETGEDVELIDAQIASDNRRADTLGLTLDSDPRRTAKGGTK